MSAACIANKENFHVVPRDDLRDHELTHECWCRPVINEDEIIVHNSMDRREEYEEGRKLS